MGNSIPQYELEGVDWFRGAVLKSVRQATL